MKRPGCGKDIERIIKLFYLFMAVFLVACLASFGSPVGVWREDDGSLVHTHFYWYMMPSLTKMYLCMCATAIVWLFLAPFIFRDEIRRFIRLDEEASEK